MKVEAEAEFGGGMEIKKEEEKRTVWEREVDEVMEALEGSDEVELEGGREVKRE